MAQSRVTQARQDDILVVSIDQPPVNALSFPLRLALSEAIEAAQANPEIAAIVIRAEGRSFAAGGDITEFGKPSQAPLLCDLCTQIEDCPKPVVVALQGAALGGGLELALAAHGRVALATVQLGLPEINLGILPGAGGTQRLPRLIGAEQALRLMLGGKPVFAAEALALGFLDQVVEADLLPAAVQRARQLMQAPLPRSGHRRDGMRDGLVYQRAVLAARSHVAPARLPAPARIVDCVEAAQLLPLEQGLAFERAAFDDLVATPEAAALRHAFFAERRAARFPESATAPRDLQRVGVMGVAGVGLIVPLLLAGFVVALVDGNRPALVKALEQVAAGLELRVVSGEMDETSRDAHWARLTPALGVAAFADVDLVLVAEADALREAAEGTPPGVVLALTGRGAGIEGARARDMLGLRLLGPQNRLAELMVGPQTGPQAVATLALLCRKIERAVVRSAAPGGVAGRVMVAGRAAVLHLRNAGVPEADIGAALADFGLPMLMGHEAGTPPAAVQTALMREITTRVLTAMANEGARLLGRGMALRPSDIDFALVAGYGFPRWEGGPMHWADQRGLLVLRKDLRAWTADGPELWTPAPLFDSLISEGRKLADLV